MITIVKQENGILTTNSREVAEMIGKRHDHLMRDIRSYANIIQDSPELGCHNFFIESTYINSQNKEQPCYLLTRKGCDMVANKMTGKKGVLFTAAYVSKFEEMEKQLMEIPQFKLPQTYKEALIALVAAEEEKELLLIENKEMKPKAEVYDMAMTSTDLLNMNQVAKIINAPGIGRNKLFKILRDKKILMDGNLPYQKLIDRGLFEVVETVVPTKGMAKSHVFSTTYVTQRGLEFIINVLKENK